MERRVQRRLMLSPTFHPCAPEFWPRTPCPKTTATPPARELRWRLGARTPPHLRLSPLQSLLRTRTRLSTYQSPRPMTPGKRHFLRLRMIGLTSCQEHPPKEVVVKEDIEVNNDV